MRSLLVPAFLLLQSFAEEDCVYSIELLALQDASNSFYDHVERWASTAGTLMQRLQNEFGEFKIGLSSFTDKPVPVSGYGSYGGWAALTQDYCYENNVPLTSDIDELTTGLHQLVGKIGSGFDIPEDQIEAMLFALLDKNVGFSPTNVTHSESGRPIARILMLLTDAKAHEAGDAASNIEKWNGPRSYPNGYGQPSTGGFGSHDFTDNRCEYCISDSLREVEYPELADLYAIKDAHDAGAGPALTAAQQTRMDDLIMMMGPEQITVPVPHPGDDSMDCTLTEYPSMDSVVDVLLRKNILPIFMGNTDDSIAYFQWYEERTYKPRGLNTVISRFDADTVFDDMVKAISSMVEKQCLTPQTEPPTEAPTTEAETEPPTEAPTTEAETEPETEAAETTQTEAAETTQTEAAETTQTQTETEIGVIVPPVIVPPNQEATGEAVEPTPAPESPTNIPASEPSPAEEEATSTAPISQPPVIGESSGGSSTGTIAGATAGAAAGLAAIGGVLYKTLGAGFFGGGTPELLNMDQVETPQTPVEREDMAEVTMDMFN